MKYFAVLLLVGFGLVSANPLGCGREDLEIEQAAEGFLLETALEAEKSLTLDEVKEQLNERLKVVLKKIKDAIDQGKEMKDEAVQKFRELSEKLKNLGIDNDRAREMLEKIEEKGKEFVQKILERLGFDGKEAKAHAEIIAAAEDLDIDSLKDKFNDLLQKVKDAFEQGKSVKEALDKLNDIREKLKLLNIDFGEKGREYLEKLKEKVKDYWQKLKEKLGISKRNADIDVFGMLEELKQMIKDKFGVSKLKEFVQKFLEKGSELKQQLMNLLEQYGGDKKQAILDWIDRVLAQRSPADVYERIKDYFRELNIELKEKFTRFGEWVKNQYLKGLEKGKTNVENVKRIAKEFLKDTQKISKDLAQEALDFFREYKEDMGHLYDEIVEKVREIRRNN